MKKETFDMEVKLDSVLAYKVFLCFLK